MPEEMWHCKDCGQAYVAKGQAEECEKHHIHIIKGEEIFKPKEKFPDKFIFRVMAIHHPFYDRNDETEEIPLSNFEPRLYEITYQKILTTSHPA